MSSVTTEMKSAVRCTETTVVSAGSGNVAGSGATNGAGAFSRIASKTVIVMIPTIMTKVKTVTSRRKVRNARASSLSGS